MIFFDICRIRDFSISKIDLKNSIIKLSVSEVRVTGNAEDVFQIRPGDLVSVTFDQVLGTVGYEEFDEEGIDRIGFYKGGAEIEVLEVIESQSISDNTVRATLICNYSEEIEYYEIEEDSCVGGFK